MHFSQLRIPLFCIVCFLSFTSVASSESLSAVQEENAYDGFGRLLFGGKLGSLQTLLLGSSAATKKLFVDALIDSAPLQRKQKHLAIEQFFWNLNFHEFELADRLRLLEFARDNHFKNTERL